MSGWYTKNVRLAWKNACLHRQLSVFSPRQRLGTAFANCNQTRSNKAIIETAKGDKNGYQHHIFRFYLFFAVYKANFILV